MSRHWPAMPRRSSASLSDVVSSFAARSTTGSVGDVIVDSASRIKLRLRSHQSLLGLFQHRLVSPVHDLTHAHTVLERDHHRPLALGDRFGGSEHAGDV